MDTFTKNQKALTDAIIKEGKMKTVCACGRVLTNPKEIEFWEGVGECSLCDASRSDSIRDHAETNYDHACMDMGREEA